MLNRFVEQFTIFSRTFSFRRIREVDLKGTSSTFSFFVNKGMKLIQAHDLSKKNKENKHLN